MSRSRQITGILASTACPITAVSAALSLGATISRSGFWRIHVSTCATCLLLSCCASAITSFTSEYWANSLVMKAFCMARYGSALLAWLNATTSCFLSPSPQEARRIAPSEVRCRRVMKLIGIPLALHHDRQHDDHGFDHHLD